MGRWASGPPCAKSSRDTREQRCWVHKTANVLNKSAQERAAQGQGRSARDLDGRDAGECRQGLRALPGKIRSQVREGLRMPEQGPRRAADVLRLPSRALGAPAHHQSDRIHLRHDPPTPSPNQRQRNTPNQPGHDVQTRRVGLQTLEAAQGTPENLSGTRRPKIQGRNHAGTRRLTPPLRTQHLTIPPQMVDGCLHRVRPSHRTQAPQQPQSA